MYRRKSLGLCAADQTLEGDDKAAPLRRKVGQSMMKSKQVRPIKPDEDVRKAWGDLNYERFMFEATANLLGLVLEEPAKLLVSKEYTEAVQYAFLESFLMHFRNPWDFMCSNSRIPDDVLAIDFLRTEDKLVELRRHVPERLKEYHERAHKMVAHLTYTRSNLEDKKRGWPVGQIANDVLEAIRQFDAMVQPSKDDVST